MALPNSPTYQLPAWAWQVVAENKIPRGAWRVLAALAMRATPCHGGWEWIGSQRDLLKELGAGKVAFAQLIHAGLIKTMPRSRMTGTHVVLLERPLRPWWCEPPKVPSLDEK